ncbi:unnamed protein product [Trichobilharzia regenti]|nr:unnamed protein product [Trichobilharzia regenti]
MNYLAPLCQGRIKPDDLPVISPRTIYFFVCSAYTDFTLERRCLQESTYREIRKYSQETYGLDVCVSKIAFLMDDLFGIHSCFSIRQFIDPRPLEDNLPLEQVEYAELFKKLSHQYCHNDLNCCPIVS